MKNSLKQRNSEKKEESPNRQEKELNIFHSKSSSVNAPKLIFINEDEAKDQIINCLFHKAPIKPSVLNDKKLFEDLEEGLEYEEKQWIRDKRDKLLDIAERIKIKRLQKKLEVQKHDSNCSLINIDLGCDQNKTERLTLSRRAERIKEAGRSRDYRIQVVKRMKEDIMNNKRREIKDKIRQREYRNQMFTTKNMIAITGTWIEYSVLKNVGEIIAHKFQIRKETRFRVMKLGRQVCWILKSIGMFIVRIKKVREKIALRKIQRFVRGFCRHWIERKKQQKREIIYWFLKYRKENELMCKFVKFYNIVSKVQKRMKMFLARRIMRYAIINGHWTKIERTMILK